MTNHEFHRHDSVDFSNHQKRDESQAIAGKLIIQTYEREAEVPLKQTENQAETNGADERCQGIKTQRMFRRPARPELNEEENSSVLYEQHNDSSEKEVNSHRIKFFFR